MTANRTRPPAERDGDRNRATAADQAGSGTGRAETAAEPAVRADRGVAADGTEWVRDSEAGIVAR